MATYRYPRSADPDDGTVASKIGKPRPAHTLTPEAEAAVEAVRAAALGRRERHALRDLEQATDAPLVSAGRESARRVDPATLGGSAASTARKLADAGATVRGTVAADHSACSVWAIGPDGQRIRCLYERNAQGTWSSRGAILNGFAYGITAALDAFATPRE